MFSLWNLAQIGKQPDLQYLDVETLNEINKHKPAFSLTSEIPFLTTEDSAFFFSPNLILTNPSL